MADALTTSSSEEGWSSSTTEDYSGAIDETEAATSSFPERLLFRLAEGLFNGRVWALRSEWARLGDGVGREGGRRVSSVGRGVESVVWVSVVVVGEVGRGR